jgi:hypothetical protein
VTEPGERLELFKFFAFKRLPRRVKRETCHQNLVSLSEGLHARTGIDLQTVEMPGFSASLFIVKPDFSDVDPNSVKYRLTNLGRERPKPSLHQKRKFHRIRWLCKNDEKRIASVIDFFALAELA